MIEAILVGVTDSSASRKAVDWAVERARASGGTIELISIVGGAVGVVGEGEVLAEAVRKTDLLLQAEARRIRSTQVPVTMNLGRGKPVEMLIHASGGFDLLVIGSDYRGPRMRPTRGPRGLRIAAGAHCPVVVVPDIDLKGRSDVVVGVDGSALSEHALNFAAAEASRTGDSLIAISAWLETPLPLDVRSYPQNYTASMQKLTEETLAISLAGLAQDYPDLNVRRIVQRGYPETVINRFAARARLTVIGSHGRGMFGRFLLGSTGEGVLARLATVTVVVREIKHRRAQ